MRKIFLILRDWHGICDYLFSMIRQTLSKSGVATDFGLTLLEVLTVIAIVGILAALAFPVMGALQNRAAKTQDMTNLRSMAQAVLLYDTDQGRLPGRLNRGIKVPRFIPANERDRWLSTFLIDAGYVTGNDDQWTSPLNNGANEIEIAYILNNTVQSAPRNFFGLRGSTQLEPQQIINIVANIKDGPYNESNRQPLSEIWMATNADGMNYGSAATGGSQHAVPDAVSTPWNGRHYVFFDGRVEFRTPDNYPSHN
jgi:prepilin-type N-terminal cleavage/methylation domain-containing protein